MTMKDQLAKVREAEVWKEVVGYEGRYEVSNMGKVKSLITNKIMRTCVSKKGYRVASLYRAGEKKTRNYLVHKMVMDSFVGELEGFQVNHVNGDPSDNRLQNLEYVTPRENINHRLLNNKNLRGTYKQTWSGRYSAAIKIKGKRKNLGTFDTEKQAHDAYVAEVNKLKESKYVR